MPQLFDLLFRHPNLAQQRVRIGFGLAPDPVSRLLAPSPCEHGTDLAKAPVLGVLGLQEHLAGQEVRIVDELRHGVDGGHAGVGRGQLGDPVVAIALGERLRAIANTGVTVFLIDHDMGLVLDVCDTIHVLDFGSIIASGPPDEIRNDRVVVAAYLGRTAAST